MEIKYKNLDEVQRGLYSFIVCIINMLLINVGVDFGCAANRQTRYENFGSNVLCIPEKIDVLLVSSVILIT